MNFCTELEKFNGDYFEKIYLKNELELQKRFLVGIISSDPYWKDRWVIVVASDESQAILRYFEYQKHWLKSDEKRFVQVITKWVVEGEGE